MTAPPGLPSSATARPGSAEGQLPRAGRWRLRRGAGRLAVLDAGHRDNLKPDFRPAKLQGDRGVVHRGLRRMLDDDGVAARRTFGPEPVDSVGGAKRDSRANRASAVVEDVERGPVVALVGANLDAGAFHLATDEHFGPVRVGGPGAVYAYQAVLVGAGRRFGVGGLRVRRRW